MRELKSFVALLSLSFAGEGIRFLIVGIVVFVWVFNYWNLGKSYDFLNYSFTVYYKKKLQHMPP